jgi:4-hydroxy-3-polyprenylbenzoate decarboxylase
VGISGASAPQLGIRALEVLCELGVETHLVITRGARRTIELEADGMSVAQVQALATRAYAPEDLAACIASGSFRTAGMVIAPCSMKTVAEVAMSLSGSLLTRAADVTLKEGRPLVLLPRESPLHLGHLRNLTRACETGARIVPPVIGAYYQPRSLQDVIDHIVGRALDQLGIEHELVGEWAGPAPTPRCGSRYEKNIP